MKSEGPVATAVPAAAGSTYWTGFRGPRRNGTYDQQPILTAWPSDGPKPLWKQPVGGGYASFAIARGRAFTIEQRGPQEVVAAYDVHSGRELWTNAWNATFRESMGGDGPRATPAWADGRVFALGGIGELRCLDEATGQVVWRTDILEDAGANNLQWGMAGSPLVVDDTVIVQPGGSGGQSVVAYSKATGKRTWAALDDQQSYSSPMVAELAGLRQLLVFSATRVVGLTHRRRPGALGISVEDELRHQRLAAGRRLGEPGVPVDRIRPGRGDAGAHPRRAEVVGARSLAQHPDEEPVLQRRVLHEGYLYGLDESILACLDAATGDVKWKGGRYGYGQVVLASGHLIVLTEVGRAGPGPCDAREPSGAAAGPRDRGQDLEPSGAERRVSAHSERQRDGRLRSEALKRRRRYGSQKRSNGDNGGTETKTCFLFRFLRCLRCSVFEIRCLDIPHRSLRPEARVFSIVTL